MTEPVMNPYDILGVSRSASADDIKQAYFAQVRVHPPEREPEVFKRIRAAYDQLRVPEKRLDADMRLFEDWPYTAKQIQPGEPDLTVHPWHIMSILMTSADAEMRAAGLHFREVNV